MKKHPHGRIRKRTPKVVRLKVSSPAKPRVLLRTLSECSDCGETKWCPFEEWLPEEYTYVKKQHVHRSTGEVRPLKKTCSDCAMGLKPRLRLRADRDERPKKGRNA